MFTFPTLPSLESILLNTLPKTVRKSLHSLRKALYELQKEEPLTAKEVEQVVYEFERWLPRFLVACLLASMLPKLQESFVRRYLKIGALKHEAEDVGQEAAKKMMKNLFGNWPRGNLNGYLNSLRRNVGIDALRKMKLKKERVRSQNPSDFAGMPALDEIEILFRDLSLLQKKIVSWTVQRRPIQEIAKQLGLTVPQVQEVLNELKA